MRGSAIPSADKLHEKAEAEAHIQCQPHTGDVCPLLRVPTCEFSKACICETACMQAFRTAAEAAGC